MSRRFAGRAVLVTGGGSGIGRAVAQAFAGESAAVTVAGRSPGPLAETVALIRASGGTATAVPADITRAADVAALVDTVVTTHGRLDVAVNAAGTLAATGPVGDIDERQWEAMLATNLTGTLLSMKYEIAAMRSRGGGAIVNIASNLGAHRRAPGLAGYIATKAAVSALTRAAALDHIGDGIRINAVSPGPVDTPMSLRPGEKLTDRDARLRTQLPIGRVGSVAEIAAAVLYLASPEAGYAVGADLVLDGGAAA